MPEETASETQRHALVMIPNNWGFDGGSLAFLDVKLAWDLRKWKRFPGEYEQLAIRIFK